jgi:recombination protein RecA
MAKNKVHKVPAKVAEDKQAALSQACLEIARKWGDGAVQRMGDKVGVQIPTVPTGLYSVDNYVIGPGGFPRGKLSEVYGPYSSGKTSLVLSAIGEAQGAGGLAAFIDAEHALDINYAAALGVDVPSLLISQPDSGEQGLDIAESLVRSGAVDIVVIDSVAALVPQAELDGEIGDSNVGLQARLMSQACRKLVGAVNKTNTAFVFLNQLREKVGVMYGSPEVTTGGKALSFYASLRLDVRRIKTNTEGDEAVSNTVKIKAVKNKISPPFRETEVTIEFGKGFSKVGSLLQAGITNGAIEKSGSWLSFQGDKLGQGVDNAAVTLEANGDLYDAVYAAVLNKDQEDKKLAA